MRRWWREQPATLERPASARDVVLQKASVHEIRLMKIGLFFRDGGEDLLCIHTVLRISSL